MIVVNLPVSATMIRGATQGAPMILVSQHLIKLLFSYSILGAASPVSTLGPHADLAPASRVLLPACALGRVSVFAEWLGLATVNTRLHASP